MGLDDFFASAIPAVGGSHGVPESIADPSAAPANVPEGGAPQSGEEEAKEAGPVTEITLPSQIGVRFYPDGHKYEIRQLFHEKAEFTEWHPVPSMSTVCKILDKPGLVYWAEKVGVNLVQELLRENWADPEFIRKYVANEDKSPDWWGGEHLLEIGAQKGLRNWQIKEQAGGRGTSVHSALEGWAMSGSLPDPDAYPELEQGFVKGLNRFLVESRFEPVMSEVMVASVDHEVAGRFDMLGRFPADVELTYHLTAKNEYRRVFTRSELNDLIDLKTSKGVYEDHHLQVTGYMGCLVESGYDQAGRGFVLRVARDGRYELVRVESEWTDFWFLRGLYEGLNRIDLAARAAAKKGAK